MYRCPCGREIHTKSESDSLDTNKNYHKYCKINDCFGYSDDFECFEMVEDEDEIATMKRLAKKYNYILTVAY